MGMRELAALVGALGCAALAASGCGGGQDGRSLEAAGHVIAQAPAPATTPAVPPADAAATAPKPHSFAVSELAELEERAVRRLRSFRAAQQARQDATATAEQRSAIGAVRDLVEAVLVTSGLEFATYDVLEGGSTVVIDVARRDACALRPGDATALQDKIVDSSDVVEHVRVRLTPAGSLPRYLKANCTQPTAAPTGLGATLLTEARDGIHETRSFRVNRSRWTIEWTSASTLLQISVIKDGRLQSVAVDHEGRGSGSKTLTGRGTYTLRIAGTARWRVRVRDGAARPQQAVVLPEPASAP
jgi:hypothetical protein